MASDEAQVGGYSPAYWAEQARGAAKVRRYIVRLAIGSEAQFQRVLDDLRWDAGIDTLSREWAAGADEARVECFGDLGAVTRALDAAGRAGNVLAVLRD